MKYLIMLLGAIFMMSACSTSNHKEESNKENKVEITVAAAASLNEALSDIKNKFEKENKNTEVILNLAGSGLLKQQIIQGAPIDVFISASKEQFDELLNEQLIDKNNHQDLLKNRLVLITPTSSSNKNIKTIDDLANPRTNKFAIGTPETVPAGMYAKEMLESIRAWDDVKDHLVLGKDVKQVLTYVETGNVDAGIVYYTDAKTSKKVIINEEIDETTHSPIVYPAGMIQATKHKNESERFFQYLRSHEAQKIFKKYGFIVLD